MLVEFAAAGMLGKARQQPERVRQLADKVRTDGLLTTVDTVRARLDEPVSLGYACCGEVVGLGDGVTGLSIGDLVASNGPHAELVSVPQTLCAQVPIGVSAEEAAFATLGAVALQGVRLAAPDLGETFVVTGLGLIGLLAVQLLRASGCAVIGVDPNPDRLALAERLGAQTVRSDGSVVETALHLSRGRGVDGVILTASTPSSEPVRQAAHMCRKRGRIILVGVTGLDLQRADFYEKELSFQVSCAYGPGRYDPIYEEKARDYPAGYVRWTAGRNLEAVLDMLDSKRLDVNPLITHRFLFTEAKKAYETLTNNSAALGIILDYGRSEPRVSSLARPSASESSPSEPVAITRMPIHARIGVIGAGQFASTVLLPALHSAGAELAALVGSGASAAAAMSRFGIGRLVPDAGSLLEDDDIDAIVVATRHDSHADLVARALEAGKHVFVEKPLAIDTQGLERVVAAWEHAGADGGAPIVGIGFNRRFAPITVRMVELLRGVAVPKVVTITVNAGGIPAEHWTQDPLIGGGRIIGEGCHFIDLARHLTGSEITAVWTAWLGGPGPSDSAVVTLQHDDGSISSINYLTNGSKRYPKEQVTVFGGSRVLANSNFLSMRAFGFGGARPIRLLRQDKGHAVGVRAFVQAVQHRSPYPIPFMDIAEVTAATLLAAER
ncbi:MAG: bi-domain-containing oxidoreductase [Acidimicrobiales bacterium]|jgi:predicted dehydrogenase/threonine dehydrogenase-like Zn-dependent dehydrogenase